VPAQQLDLWRQAIDRHLSFGFPGLGRGVIAFCWPIRNEYDARHLLRRLRDAGASCALPVVVAPRSPLLFRPWHPGVPMAMGALDIPYPSSGEPVLPDTVLLPMNGFDRQGFRLGYGGGFFDRTLQHLREHRPRVIGVTFEIAAIATIQPQPWDIAVDFVVTERGLYRRDGEAADATLEFLGVPQPLGVELSSPVCYLPAASPVD
jgi:5-formyltetrahydrofolate cyclo-ligase